MLGPLAFEAVRQQQHEAAQPPPLLFGAGDELVDDHLGGVDEVAELRLPQHQPVRAVEAVAVLEAQHAGLGQRAVVDLDRRLVRCDVSCSGMYVLAVLDVVQHRVPLAERAALACPGRSGARACPRRPGVAKASASAAAQSSGRLPVGHLARAFEQPLRSSDADESLRAAASARSSSCGQPVPLDAGVDVFGVASGAAVIAAPDAGRRLAYGHVVVAPRGSTQLAARARSRRSTAIRSASSRVTPPSFEQVLEVALAHRLALLDRLDTSAAA